MVSPESTQLVTLSRVATVLSSGAPAQDRVFDLLHELRRTIPFEAGLLSCVHPLSGNHHAFVNFGYADRVANRLLSEAFHEEFIDRFDMIATRWPLRERDLPVDPLTVPSIAEYLTPSGLIEGIVAPLVDAAGVYTGCLFLSTADKRHPSDSARDLIGRLTPALTNLVDPRQSLERLASTLEPRWATIGIAPNGATVPVGSAASASLDPGGPLVRAAAACARRRPDSGLRFVWPKDDGRGWMQVRVHPCLLDAGDDSACYGAVVAACELDSEPGLTKRELEVLTALASGRTNPEIAARLGVARPTVKAHVEHILDKLGAPTRAAAAAYAIEEGLLLPSPFTDPLPD